MAAPILAASSLILVGGRLGDFFGKRRMFRLGLFLFTLGLLSSALSPNVALLITGQLLIGFGISFSAPACLSLIKQEIDENEQGSAIGLWAGLSGAFGVLGLLLGGVIIEHLGWSALFYVTTPFVLFAMLVVPKEHNPISQVQTTSIPWAVVTALIASLFLVVWSIIQGNQDQWSGSQNFALLGAGLMAFVFIIYWQNQGKNPLIPLNIFRNKTVLGANLGTFFIYFSLNGVYIFLIYHLQSYYVYPPSQAGWAMLPASLVVAVFASIFGKLSQKGNPVRYLRWGSLIVTLGFIGLILPGAEAAYLTHFFPSILLLGFGMALFVSPITSFALSVSPQENGLASGINNMIARFSGMLAVGILGGIMNPNNSSLEAFQTVAWLMAVSAVLGTLCLWAFIRSNKA